MKILVVDLSSVVRLFWEMDLGGKLSDGAPLRASVDYITRSRDGFDRVVLALDVGPSFRKLYCPEYKAKRSDPGEAYRKCYRDVIERLRKDGATFFPNREEQKTIVRYREGDDHDDNLQYYPEADDVIASIAKWYRDRHPLGHDGGPPDHSEEWTLRILSGDTDLWALVNDSLAIEVQPINGERDSIIHEADVAKRFGGVGSWVTEVKALAGDETDGYRPFRHPEPPGENGKEKPGIGVNTAIDLVGMVPEHTAEAVVLLARDPSKSQVLTQHVRKCLLAARGGGIEVGYACARMLTALPLDFSRILAEPKIEPLTEQRKTPSERPAAEAPKESRSMTKYEPATESLDRYGLQPHGIDQLELTAKFVVDSRAYPRLNSLPKAMVVIAEAREHGVGFATAARCAFFVHDQLAWHATYLAGLVLRSPVCHVFEIVETTKERAVLEYQRKGRPLRQYEYTLEQAKEAGYVTKDSRWQKDPRTMLRWAAMREAARAFFSDVINNLYTPEELKQGQVIDGEFES